MNIEIDCAPFYEGKPSCNSQFPCQKQNKEVRYLLRFILRKPSKCHPKCLDLFARLNFPKRPLHLTRGGSKLYWQHRAAGGELCKYLQQIISTRSKSKSTRSKSLAGFCRLQRLAFGTRRHGPLKSTQVERGGENWAKKISCSQQPVSHSLVPPAFMVLFCPEWMFRARKHPMAVHTWSECTCHFRPHREHPLDHRRSYLYSNCCS